VKVDENVGEVGWESDGMEAFEEERVRRLEIVKRFGQTDVEDWKDL